MGISITVFVIIYSMTQNLLSQEEHLRYSRHLMVPEIGLEGQKKLKSASVLIVGAGGLGSPAALYLAAAGVGRIGIVDDDVVAASNLQRQVIHGSADLDRPKVESAKARMTDLNPFIQVDAHFDFFNEKNAERIAESYDLILDCADNFATRYLVNDLCALTGKADVYGAVYRFEGQVSVFDARIGPCYRCLFPEPPPVGAAPTCGEAGVFGLTPGLIGTLQAVEAIKLILGIGEPLVGKLLMADTLSMSFRTINLRKRPDCPLCGEKRQITHLIDYPAFCAAELGQPLREDEKISPAELVERLKQPNPPLLLDVRSEVELQISKISGSLHIPIEQLPLRLGELAKNRNIVVFCRNGTRSSRAVRQLKDTGIGRVKNLTGGINAWAREVDKGMFEY